MGCSGSKSASAGDAAPPPFVARAPSLMETAHAQAAEDPAFRHPWEDKFDSMDSNGNGVLDGAELLELAGWAWSSLRPPTTAPPSDAVKLAERTKIMQRCDKNHDGELSRDEFEAYYMGLTQSILRWVTDAVLQKAFFEKQTHCPALARLRSSTPHPCQTPFASPRRSHSICHLSLRRRLLLSLVVFPI